MTGQPPGADGDKWTLSGCSSNASLALRTKATYQRGRCAEGGRQPRQRPTLGRSAYQPAVKERGTLDSTQMKAASPKGSVREGRAKVSVEARAASHLPPGLCPGSRSGVGTVGGTHVPGPGQRGLPLPVPIRAAFRSCLARSSQTHASW